MGNQLCGTDKGDRLEQQSRQNQDSQVKIQFDNFEIGMQNYSTPQGKFVYTNDHSLIGKVIIPCSLIQQYGINSVNIYLISQYKYKLFKQKVVLATNSTQKHIDKFQTQQQSFISIPFQYDCDFFKYNTYMNNNVSIKYYLIIKGQAAIKEVQLQKQHILVNSVTPDYIIQQDQKNIELDVGIEDFIYLKVALDKQRYYMTDQLNVNLQILLLKLKIKQILCVIKQTQEIKLEKDVQKITNVVYEHVISNISPAQGDKINYTLNLSDIPDLAPSIENMPYFKLGYGFFIVLIDQQEQRYFKSSPITIFR